MRSVLYIVAYSKGYRSVMFIVYDLGYVRDESEFRRDSEAPGNASVVIVKH